MASKELTVIWAELKKHKSRLTVVAIGGLLMASSDTAIANLIKYVFDGLQQGNVEVIKKTFSFIIALSFLKGLSRYLHLYQMNFISELVAQSLRQRLQMKFMSLNLSFHNTFASGSGGLISRVMNDIMVTYHGLRLFADFCREPFLAAGLIGTLLYLNWKLTFTIIFVLPLVMIFLKIMSKSIKKYGTKGQEDLEKISSIIKESLDGIRIIQSFNLESEMSRKFEAQNDEFLSSRKRLHKLIEVSGPVTEFIMTLVIFSIILYMAFDISSGKSTLGDAMAYFAALLMMQSPVKKLQESYVRVQETLVALKRAIHILEEKNEVPQLMANQNFPSNWSTIEYKNVTFRYGDNEVLKNINFKVSRGEKVAFVGPSGSGKSTIVNLLERFFDPSSGEILIDNTSIDHIKLKELRHNIALVTQDVFLFSDTIERNIWAGDFSKAKEGVVSASRAANAEDFILKSPDGYQNKVGDRGNLLSGGEKQRISIARALFKNAPILILDEATSALDSKSEIEVQKGLDLLTEGRTAFIIAHRLSTIAKADRIFVLKNGEIIEIGSHQDLLNAKGEYFHLYQLQNQF